MWDLGQVCTRWRSVAHAEPLLWAHLGVGAWPGDEASESAFHFLHDILSCRGGQGRVEIEIYPGTPDSWRTLLHLVSTHSFRVWKLTLILDQAFSEPLSLPVRAFDNVESVSLSIIMYISILAFANSPKIRTAILNFNGSSPEFLGNNPGSVFPWTQLTDLSLENIHPTSAVRVLTYCSQLITLELGLFSLIDIQDEESLVLLGGLQSLSIYLHSPGLLDILLSQLILPSLREFQVEYYDNERRWFSIGFPGFVAFIERSGCSINSVRIPNFTLDIQDIIPTMRVLPQLTELVIDTVDPTPEHDLSIIQTERLLPNLRKFEGCTFSSIHSAIEFLKGRWALTTSGNYHGLENFIFRLARDDYSAADQEILENLLPEWEKNGRRVQLVIEQR